MRYRSRTEQWQEFRPTVILLSNSVLPLWYLEMAYQCIAPDFTLNLEPVVMDLNDAYEKCKQLAQGQYKRVFWIIELELLLSMGLNKGISHAETISRLQSIVAEFSQNTIVSVVINNPSFEIWLQLHFEKLSDSYESSGNKVQTSLKIHLPGYKRERSFYQAQDNVYSKTLNHLPTAFKNASSVSVLDFPSLKYARTMMPLIINFFKQ